MGAIPNGWYFGGCNIAFIKLLKQFMLFGRLQIDTTINCGVNLIFFEPTP
jgi:hypothetical protein